MSRITFAMKAAKQHYTEDGFAHAIRVATYISENELIPYERRDFCFTLALLHDLEEDTEFKLNSVSGLEEQERLGRCLKLLTKEKGEDYIEYIKRIKDNVTMYQEAYWVKLADMKDHLAQTETLTEKLKDKYLRALPYLL